MSQQQYQMMMQHPYYQQMNQARMAQSTPNPGAVPAAQTAGQSTPARNSPMVAAQTIASRSPMPQNPQQAALAAQQQSYGYSTMQMQYGTQMRPMAHPQYHMVPGNAAGGQQIQPGQQPQEQPPVPQVMAQYPPMYPMNYQIGPVGQNRFWPVGRGIPVVNGQHPMPGMPPHPQQMALGAGKVPGGMQGS
ncbi:hypothetical protein NLI96_g11949 [Meripilus lineatus]|uniref:Uncharacterized protein n=1 Tax=Meripilus lineatus TaxID=2056292 RepID=A0AAD5USH0_9APHY|nr:hypothetical protein NLI96_g11949 [Physisporinus lineatus]